MIFASASRRGWTRTRLRWAEFPLPPGLSDFVARHPCLFPRRPAARVTFLSGKVTKAICAGHDDLANVRLARLRCASRAKRAGANSHIPVLRQLRLAPAWRCDARRHATARESSLRYGHPWPAPLIGGGTGY